MARILGLDIGIGSCGWALLDTETIDPATGEVAAGPSIVACGARCFDVPEEPKTKELKNKARRTARGQRRVTRRRRQRLAAIRRLLQAEGLPLPGPMPPKTPADRVWRLRAEGLDRLLSAEEWARVLIHLARHRGFKSMSKRERLDNKSDAGKALQGIAQLQQVAAGYRTVGEALALAPAFALRKRNTTGDYSHTVLRQDIEAEARRLFAAQRVEGNPHAAEALERRYTAIAFGQRPLRSSLDAVGPCRFEPAERRAAKRAPSFELFRFLQTINHLRLSAPGAPARPLNSHERAVAHGLFATKQELKYKHLRKALRLPEKVRFDGLAATKDPEAKLLADFTGSVKLMGALGEERFAALLESEPEKLDAAMAAIVFQSTDEEVAAALRKAGLGEDDVTALMARIDDFAGPKFKGAGHISALACRRLLPHLRAGANYSEACRLAGYDHTALGAIDLDRLPNPVVRKVIGECLKQVRVLFRKYGLPDRVHVEMARDLGKSREDRLELYRAGEERAAERERHRGEFRDLLGRLPDDEELLRYELWQEQNHRCLYSDDYISPEQLVATDNAVQVDHILPYSRSGDDGYRNKVLVTARANQEKRDRTPWEAFGESDPAWWQAFEMRIGRLGSQLHPEKRRKLLLKSFAERENAYRARHLQDTRYAVRVFRLLLEKHWPDLRTRAGEERRIFTQPGALTALVRRGLGLDQAKRSGTLGDRDHALDALVVAWTDSGVVQRLTNEAKRLECQARARLVPELVADPAEKERLRRAFLAAAEAVFVSRPETRRGRGPAHEDTLYAFTANGDGSVTRFQKIPVAKLERKHLDMLKDPERARALRQAAEVWLDEAERRGFKPGKLDKYVALHPLRMPTRDGREGPTVRHLTVQLPERIKGGMTVRRGEAAAHVDVASMVRVDVFAKDGKFYLVPIYAWQIADRARWPKPPNRAISAHKPERDWPQIDRSYEFRFSLYPGALIHAVSPTGEIHEGYYRTVNRNDGKVSYSAPAFHSSADQKYFMSKTLSSFRKFHVDRLGNRFEIVQEPRLWHGEVCS